MSKQVFEVAAEIVQEVVRARGQAISGASGSASMVKTLISEHLSDDAIATLYKEVIETVNEDFKR